MKLNKAIFLDLEGVLTKTKSGKQTPIDKTDWEFNDDIIKFIKDNEFDYIGIIVNRDRNNIISYSMFKDYTNLIIHMLSKIVTTDFYTFFNNNKDTYFKFPYPGNIYNLAIENDLDLVNSYYIASNINSLSFVSVGYKLSYSQFLLTQ